MPTTNRDRVASERLTAFFDVILGHGLSGDAVAAMASAGIAKGLFSPDVRDPRTPEERAEDRDAKEEAHKTIFHWLRNHEAPVYNNTRDTCLTASEIVDKIVKDHPDLADNRSDRSLQAITRSIIEVESTGWGLIAHSEAKRFYAKKAILITFRNRGFDPEPEPTGSDQTHAA